MARVVLENISKSFEVPKKGIVNAVRNFSLTIEDKEFLILVGPSGCGKTTVLRLIAGLEEINSGTISIDGRVVNNVEPKDRDIAMVFQNYALYPHMTVYENISFGLEMRKVPKAEIQQRVLSVAETLGLSSLLDRLPKALSGGQRQRVAVGRAIVRNPKAFLFDEPLSNLDAQMRVQMRLELTRLHQRLASTMIYVTHDQTEAMTMGDRIVVMRDGVIQQIDDPISLYNRPANTFVATFIGSPPMNLFQGTMQDGGTGVRFIAGSPAGSNPFRTEVPTSKLATLSKLRGQQVKLGVRAEAVLIRRAESGASDSNQAIIEAIEPLGAETLVHLKMGTELLVSRVAPDTSFSVGKQVTVSFDLSRLHFFDSQTGQSIDCS